MVALQNRFVIYGKRAIIQNILTLSSLREARELEMGTVNTEKESSANADAERLVQRRVMPKILHLTLKKKWFDMIASGEKKEEYREIKKHWNARLNKKYDVVEFRNGYAKDAPRVRLELLSVLIGRGRKEWGADPYERYYVLTLGNIVSA